MDERGGTVVEAKRIPDEDDYFDALLPAIEERRVIPVVGPGLLAVPSPAGDVPLYRAVAERLLQHYERSGAAGDSARASSRIALRPGHELNDAVCAVLDDRRRDPYLLVARSLSEVLKGEALTAAMQPLRELASIEAFNLFVTMTIDDLLTRAIDEVRHASLARTRQILHVPNLPTDEFRDVGEAELASPDFTAVLHLFGRARTAQLYAIHDEDTLEYVYNVQTRGSNVPERFISKLRTRDLLLIGCGFPDWLSRFVLRLSSQNRLADDRRPKREFLVQEHDDEGLIVFLERFSRHTSLFRGSPREFVRELSRRWRERHPIAAADRGVAAPAPPRPQDAVFISYAREDLSAAQRMRDQLKSIGIDTVWFDRDDLQPGDEWAGQIAAAIKHCYLFIALVSAHTDGKKEGYFREEWAQAEERSRRIAGRTFLVPVVIDAGYAGDASAYRLVPEAFRSRHFGHAPGGELTDGLRSEFVELIRDHRRAS